MKLRNLFLHISCLMAVFTLLNTPTMAQTDSPNGNRMTPELLWKLGRLGDAVTSPDGKQIAFAVRHYKLSENKGTSSLHWVDLASGDSKPLLERWSSIGSLQWIDVDGAAHLFFEGAPEAEDDAGDQDDGDAEAGDESENEEDEADAPSTQAWSINPETGEKQQITNVEDGIANLKMAPTGKKLAFTIDVKMAKKPNEIYEDLPEADARIIDGLMYRHWNAWDDYSYSHLHVAEINAEGVAGEATDLMKDIKADCPVPPFGGSEQFNWSPDGKQIAFTMKNVKDWAQSTNSDIYLIDVDGKTPARNISAENLGYDNNPVYSPDGKFLAYQSMQRPGFESDRNRIMIFKTDTGELRELTTGLDQNANHALWLADSSGLVFTSEWRGTNQLFRMGLQDSNPTQITEGQFNWDSVGTLPNNSLLVTRTSMLRPAELFRLSMDDKSSQVVTQINDDIYADLELPTIEERFVEATDGEKIQCWVIKPPGFDAQSEKKWPLLTYCQGGPQGQIGQWFSYRWNFHLMAANGYVIVAPNRRGLPGFGRKWNDDISGDWGGQAMQDLLSATDDMMLESYVDRERVGAIGASFGGYSVYWLMGNHGDRFCSMISHCGVFNLESMYGSTEELFFVDWDLGGPYWKSNDVFAEYQKFSPHRYVNNWKTPLLVIHGEKDFRVPVTQGMEAFTAAQVQGVPSRFLYFPEEGHWVMGPQNGVLWHRIFFDWLDRYCKK